VKRAARQARSVEPWKLKEIGRRLEKLHGRPPPPPARDPWLLILWENVAYLADDARRKAAFEMLRRRVGTKPRELLAASDEALVAVAGHGILAETFAAKLKECATIALELFPEGGGDFTPLREWPIEKQRRALARFPGIGAPGAEKILLFSGAHTDAHATLPLESNGLRVLTRLGFADERKSYSATYRLVQGAIAPQLTDDVGDVEELIALHQLLRRHGQELCKRTRPLCGACPLRPRCRFGADSA
jgi:endonuclease III